MSDLLGKIHREDISGIIEKYKGKPRNEVSSGPEFGVDVSIVDLPGNMALAMTSDPLTLIPSLGLQESAWLSVHLLANDMATTGFPPMYGQFVLNLPSTFSKEDFKTYWKWIDQYCKETGVAITGGHTGFIEGQTSTISGGGTFFTTGPKDKILTSKGARPGDIILVTKESALSSSSILAMSFPETVKNKLGHEVYQQACELFYKTTSLKDAIIAVDGHSNKTGVTSMHDVTEGGIMGAIFELAVASGNGFRVKIKKIPTGIPQQKICELFNIDPLFSVGAGSMIITCEPRKETETIKRLRENNIKCSVVGHIQESSYGYKIIEDDIEKDMVYNDTDPYWAAFFNALNKGWK